MRIDVLQHVPFEGPGAITNAAKVHSGDLVIHRLFAGDPVPSAEQLDPEGLLVVMGGPMGVGDTDKFAWLEDELTLIRSAVERDRAILGVCLGAQVIAAALGGGVKAGEPEHGWWPVERVDEMHALGKALFFEEESVEVFHWHGDHIVLDGVEGATVLACSPACKTQAFAIGERCLGLQFHIEMTPEGALELVANAGGDLQGGVWQQSAAEIVSEEDGYHTIRPILERVVGVLLA